MPLSVSKKLEERLRISRASQISFKHGSPGGSGLKMDVVSEVIGASIIQIHVVLCCHFCPLLRQRWNFRQKNLVWLHNLTEKAMAPHSSTFAWKIPWAEEPGRLQSTDPRRVRHDWATSLSLFTFMHWRRKWQPTPVFLPEESQGQRSLVGCRLWGRTQSDTTDAT